MQYLDEYIFLLLNQNTALAKKIAEKQVSLTGVTLSEYALLRIIQNHPNITASEARERLFITAPSLAQLTKSLRAKHLIATGTDKEDIRRQPMTLTPRGIKTVKSARTALQRSLERLRVPKKVLESLHRDLTSLLSSLSSYGA